MKRAKTRPYWGAPRQSKSSFFVWFFHIQKLEYISLSHSNTVELEQPAWEKIQSALGEILDLSQPKPSPDLIRKFVRKIVPDGKNNFRWYLNLDGSNSTAQDIIVEGRKNKATVTMSPGEEETPPEHRRVIFLETIRKTPLDSSLLTTPDRLRFMLPLRVILHA